LLEATVWEAFMPLSEISRDLLLDIADKFGFSSVEYVNKDYFVVQVLSLVSRLQILDCQFVFTGGTCMAKCYHLLKRMSEDIDITVVYSGKELLSRSQTRERFGLVKHQILEVLQQEFPHASVVADHYNQHQVFTIPYPVVAQSPLKPEVKLEISRFRLHLPAHSQSAVSLVNQETRQKPEVSNILCVDPLETLADKIVALPRRVCNWLLQSKHTVKEKIDYASIIRHVYDIYKISSKVDMIKLKDLVTKIILQDKVEYKNKSLAWIANPKVETQSALSELKKPEYKIMFDNYARGMIYDHHYPSYQVMLKEVSELISQQFS
jgi:predicted nucleotidyltransferase component of viral defense system